MPRSAMIYACLATASALAGGLACSQEGGVVQADTTYVAAMEREHAGDEPIASGAAGEPALAVVGESVVYATVDGRGVTGYLAQPAGVEDPLPGIIVIQEWWGLNDNIRAMAEKLAGEGYRALAVDLYQGEVAETRERASALMRESMNRTDALKDNLRQARSFLVEQGATKVGSIGWCFGGGWSLQTALLLGDDLDAAVIYYGRVVTDSGELAALEAPILGIFGGLDRGIPGGVGAQVRKRSCRPRPPRRDPHLPRCRPRLCQPHWHPLQPRGGGGCVGEDCGVPG